ncbi:hypothetical protein [Deinococcus marmoris]|uniref:Uncharacterized protein n=1 Tax=Deinococcus marmoris TaxID=249408 RepID=A0A1U7NTD7_9DEIO|nr:hypothetical protein [Deinococcus marmoris]OLV16188.1 hypothetical protein BOO71_0012685 [Deinococcus marmoris]
MNRLSKVLAPLLRVLGFPMYWLLRRLGSLPLKAEPASIPAPEPQPLPDDVLLPPGWTRPREMAEANPTLAPVLLAFGLAGTALGLLISTWGIVGLGVVVAFLGGGMWAWDSFQATVQPAGPQEET